MIRFVQRSAIGKVRKSNEDSVFVSKKLLLFAVADGMGGCSAGEVASRFVVEELESKVKTFDLRPRAEEVEHAVTAANARIQAYAKDHRYKQMGSTLALFAPVEENGAFGLVGYAGDSRVYRIRFGKATQLTRDHTVGAALAEEVGGKEGAALVERDHPLAHVLTRAIGTDPMVALDWRKVDLFPDDRYLICTDGVHDVIETDEIPDLLAMNNLEFAAQHLEKEVLARGAPDNYSFVLVEIGGAS